MKSQKGVCIGKGTPRRIVQAVSFSAQDMACITGMAMHHRQGALGKTQFCSLMAWQTVYPSCPSVACAIYLAVCDGLAASLNPAARPPQTRFYSPEAKNMLAELKPLTSYNLSHKGEVSGNIYLEAVEGRSGEGRSGEGQSGEGRGFPSALGPELSRQRATG